MKKLIFSFSLMMSLNAFADISMICNDNNSNAVYKIEFSKYVTSAIFTPFVGDSSPLSHSIAELDFIEEDDIFAGKNKNGNTIVLDVHPEQIEDGGIIEMGVSYSLSGSDTVDEYTSFLCSVD